MNQNDALNVMSRLVDGQTIRVTTASGRVFDGVYDAEQSGLEEGLFFESMEGTPLRADWHNVTDVGFRSARAVAGSIMVPPEHPLSGASVRRREDGSPLRPYTARNR